MKEISRGSLIILMDSIIFRIIILFLGLALILFYGMLMLAAIVNLPASWMGLLYCLFGLTSGILCIVYYFKKKKVLLAIIVPSFFLMIITLINMKG